MRWDEERWVDRTTALHASANGSSLLSHRERGGGLISRLLRNDRATSGVAARKGQKLFLFDVAVRGCP